MLMSQYNIIIDNGNNISENKFSYLKQLIIAEMARRGIVTNETNDNPNNMNITKNISNFSIPITQYGSIQYEHIDETANLLRQITTTPTSLNNYILDNCSKIEDIDVYIEIVNNLSSYNKTGTPIANATGDARYMGCGGACRGLCYNSCYSGCYGSCKSETTTSTSYGPHATQSSCSSCGNDCDGSCVTQCGVSCGYSGAAETLCGQQCTSTCYSGCLDGCAHSCSSGSCLGRCLGNCYGCGQECSGNCTGCRNECGGSCSDNCSSGCSGSCSSGCSYQVNSGNLPPTK